VGIIKSKARYFAVLGLGFYFFCEVGGLINKDDGPLVL